MHRRGFRIIIQGTLVLSLGILFSSCSSNAPQSTLDQPASSTEIPAFPSFTPSDSGKPRSSLTVWIPPFLSPQNESSAGLMFSERVQEFEEANPDVSISLRIKDETGPAGLLASLAATRMAAPSALPDIIVLDPTSLGNAVLRDLLLPLDSLFSPPSVPEWYDHSLPSAYVGDSFYGLPFASETELFVYKKDKIAETPLNWAALLSGPVSYLYPAGDKLAKFTIAQYLSQDGTLQNETGELVLDVRILSDILDFYSTSREAGIISLSALQLSTGKESWALLRQDAAQSALVPLEAYIREANRNTYGAQALPTRDGEGIIMTHTFAWALVTTDAERKTIAVDFLNWLLTPDFLGPWSHALGMLPATSAALSEWPDSGTRALVNQLIRSAVPLPSTEILNTIGPLVQLAIEDVLFGRETPEAAAQQAGNTLNNP